MSVYALILIPLLPFTAFLINGLFGKKFLKDSSQWVSIATVVGAMLISMVAFAKVASSGLPIRVELYQWAAIGDFNIKIALLVKHPCNKPVL